MLPCDILTGLHGELFPAPAQMAADAAAVAPTPAGSEQLASPAPDARASRSSVTSPLGVPTSTTTLEVGRCDSCRVGLNNLYKKIGKARV